MGYVIGESIQPTATERTNARLIVEDNIGDLYTVYYNNGRNCKEEKREDREGNN